MFVELVYDKRNVEGLEGAREIILAELTKRVHQIFPDAEVRVKPMQANGLNSDASKSDRENTACCFGLIELAVASSIFHHHRIHSTHR
ncbi:DinI-like family protein [Enterobacter kobei]|uniref:DinI-like family protein n=1 Tax=Enterobacter kobei TaxID=208224 RepID=UPI002377F728|nr:DinI-like family protein [Enterobacter kobei]MDD9237270.1 DinI-like family protein [Enterobacter kobei]